MALESVESNYVPADDGVNAGKNDSDGELEEDLEDGEIADDDEVEEGAIRDEGEVTAKKTDPSPPKPPDRQNSPTKRERSVPHEQDRNSPAGMFEHHRKRRKRQEKPRKKKRHHEPDRPHEEMHGKFNHGPDRRQGPNLNEEGFDHEEDNGRMHKRKRMDNNPEHNRNNKKNRRQSPDNNRRDHPPPQRHIPEHRKRPCIFYMQGKCHKGDHCQYLHSGNPERKFELCKFYLMDCCAKKEKCLYMHSDFPCKYFHTGMKCFAKENCKFSHEPLSEKTREILLKHIETAPKEILGDFPKLPRDQHGEVVLPIGIPPAEFGGMIPSLLDIKIYSESGEAQGTETLNEQGSSSSHYAHEMMQPNQPISKTDAVSDEEEDYDSQLRHRLHDQKHDRDSRDQDDVAPSFNFYRDTIEQSPVKKDKSPRKSVKDDSDDENGLVIMDEREDDSSQKESGNEDTPVPSNLPKRQRMLFMRIQNQQIQREAAAKSEEKDGDGDSDDNEDGGGGKDDWYSSDDEVEDTNLTEVLKNLSSTKAGNDQRPKSKTADSTYDLSSINLTDDLTKLLSTIKSKDGSTNSVDCNTDMQPHYVDSMDPRARDPRSRPEPPKASTSFTPDVDLRVAPPAKSVSGDTDLRQTMFGDTDLRQSSSMMGAMGLPFKPAPQHMPCVEIDASFASHPEIPFVLKPLPYESPDYSNVRLNFLDQAVRTDPRLKKLVSEFDSRTASPMSPPPPSMAADSGRGDPRNRGAADPRMSRAAAPPPTIIPTQQQMPPQMNMELANFMMHMAAAAAGDNQSGGLMGANPINMIMPPMMAPGNFMPNMQQQQQQQQGGYQQQHHRGNRRGWRGGRGRGRGGGFRGGRGWNKDNNRRDVRDRGADNMNQPSEYSQDSDN